MSARQGGVAAGPTFTYQPALDGLRAVAALSVVGYHLRLSGFDGGAIGVDIFFTLSGFLITSIILKEVSARDALSYRSFYARRALRLLPPYLAVVLVAVLGDVLIVDTGGTLKGAFFSFFYVANWPLAIKDAGLGALGHTWSLSIEEQFYFAWPALLVGISSLGRRFRVPIVALVSAACAAAWILTALFVFVIGVSTPMLHNATPFRATELLVGCVLAAVAARGGLRRLAAARGPASVLGLVSLVGLAALIAGEHPQTNAQIFVAWLLVSSCTAGVIASTQALGTPVGRLLSVRPMRQIGKMSYGLYLWHFPVLVSIDALVGLDSAGARMVGIVITAALTVASYYWIEQPFLRMKSRVHPTRPAERAESPLHGASAA